MKKVGVILSLVVVVFVNAMDDEPYKPTIPMINPETSEGYLAGIPVEMKAYILTTVANSTTLQKAIAALRAQAMVNTEFNAVINDLKVTRQIINMLVEKFGGYHETVARSLGTSGAKEYVAMHNNSLLVLGVGGDPLEDIKRYIASGADINYINQNGNSVASKISIDTPAVITIL